MTFRKLCDMILVFVCSCLAMATIIHFFGIIIATLLFGICVVTFVLTTPE